MKPTLGHACKVPIRLRISREGTEVVVWGISVRVIAGIQGDIWADGTGCAIAKNTNLEKT
jgi:hypothetical protein